MCQVPGCERSAMMQAFSEFMLRELGVEQDEFDVSRTVTVYNIILDHLG